MTGTLALVRLILRRDRIRLPVWLAALTAITVGTALSLADLYPDEAQRQITAETMRTPAGLAMSGPADYLADYHIGSMMGHQMLGVMAVAVAVMSVLLVVRHTRAEEESGRAELVRAGVVGRHAPLVAALAVAVAVNVVLALLLAIGMGAVGGDGVTWTGSLLYGAAHGAVGLLFAGVGAVAAQISGYGRGAAGISLAVAGVAYVLRAVGDAGTEALSWASPIGWAQQTIVYVDDRWWPLALPVAATVALAATAVGLSARRDLGAGVRQLRPGPTAASRSLAHPLGLAFRLHRALLVGFAAAMALIGLSYGSLLGEIEEMLGAIEGFEEIVADIGGATLVESFLSMVTVVMAVLASVFGVLAALRPRSEERSGRAEALLATPLSRPRWLVTHLAVAMAGSTLVLLLAGLVTGASGWLVLGDPALAGRMSGAALAYAPALWVTVGIAAALYGLVPRAATLAWAMPAYAFGVGYLGQILQLPDWLAAASPFEHVPQLPAQDVALTPLVVLTLLAAALIAAGLVGVARRDLRLD